MECVTCKTAINHAPYMTYMQYQRNSHADRMESMELNIQEEAKKGKTHEDFKDELLHKLNELREKNVLCDTTIRAQGQDFPAHRCVLSAASPYFRAMFTSQLKEKESNLVELQDTKSATISDVLRYIYIGETSIDSSNAEDLVMVADYLIIPSLKTKAAVFLEGTLNASNCLALESFASRYNCKSLKEAAVVYKVSSFADVSKSKDFRLLDLEKVKELICMDEINVADEEEVYEAVMAWVKHDVPSRECVLPELLKCVRLFSMSKYRLRKILDEELVSKNLICTRIVLKALDFFLFADRFEDITLKPRLSLEKYEHVVVLTGFITGLEEQPTQSYCFVPSTVTWMSLPMMPCPRSCHGAAVCSGLLYVVGGNESAPVCCFNPKQNKWSTLDITLDKKDCSVTAFNEELYVIGGENSWRDVQIYNPTFDEWRQEASMETARAGHNAVVLEEHIYVIAGHNGEDCQNSVECYNPLTDQWTNIPCMSKVRRSAAAVAVGGKIIVVGGFGDMTDRTIEPSCEIFDPSTNQWSLVPSLSIHRAASGIVSVGDTVYLFGGEDESSYKTEVHCFDIRTNKWDEISTIPADEGLSFLQASLLKLPKKCITH